MPHTFASPEWIDAYWNELRGDEDVRRECASWVYGPAVMLIEAQPEKSFEDDVPVLVHMHEGDTREVRPVARDLAWRAPFVLSGPYERWKAVAQGGTDAVESVLAGRLTFKGDLPTLVRHRELVTAITDAAGRVDTRFPDDADTA